MIPEDPADGHHGPSESSDLSAVHDELAGLSDLFRRRLLAARETRQALDVLQTQLDRQNDLATGQVLRPLLYDLVLVVDRIDRTDHADREAGHPGVGALTASIRLELLGLLEKYGVTPIPHLPRFDATRQEAVGTVPTNDPALVGTIHQITRAGYAHDTGVIRPQQVTVYTSRPSHLA